MSVAEAGRPERHDRAITDPYTVPVDLLLLYTRSDQLLVGLRQGGFAAGQWDTPPASWSRVRPSNEGWPGRRWKRPACGFPRRSYEWRR
jgi:hypothetical protein